jgi:hypothetical protein
LARTSRSRSVTRIAEGIGLIVVQQGAGLRDVSDVGRRAEHCVHETRLGVHADVGLHAEVPLLAIPGLAHLAVARVALILGRARLA